MARIYRKHHLIVFLLFKLSVSGRAAYEDTGGTAG